MSRCVDLGVLGSCCSDGPIDHEDGNRNHGYVRIKGDPSGARRIPEAEAWPELVLLLDSINADASPKRVSVVKTRSFPSQAKVISMWVWELILMSSLPIRR